LPQQFLHNFGYQVSEMFFNFMNELWGTYTIDRFANSTNAKLSRFNSLFWNVNTEAVDARAMSQINLRLIRQPQLAL
jgi:hypothetical protein